LKKKITKYLSTDLKQSLINDVLDVAYYHAHPSRKKEAGFFSVPRDVFCYLDYLGQIAFGNGNTESAEDFIKTYFPKTYRDYAELIYSMWRHGTVHEYKPKTFFAEYPNNTPKRIKVAWRSNNDRSKKARKEHLKFYQMDGKRNTLFLTVNTCQLVEDLMVAIDAFVDALKIDSQLRTECQKRLTEAAKEKDYRSIKRKQSKNAVYKQILQAWKSKESVKLGLNGEVHSNDLP